MWPFHTALMTTLKSKCPNSLQGPWRGQLSLLALPGSRPHSCSGMGSTRLHSRTRVSRTAPIKNATHINAHKLKPNRKRYLNLLPLTLHKTWNSVILRLIRRDQSPLEENSGKVDGRRKAATFHLADFRVRLWTKSSKHSCGLGSREQTGAHLVRGRAGRSPLFCFNDQEKADPVARRPLKVQQDETHCGDGAE